MVKGFERIDLPERIKIWLWSINRKPGRISMEIDKKNEIFWQKIGNIDGICIRTGLARVSGQREAFQQSLKLMLKEIEKCIKNLNDFYAEADLHNFSIEVHSMKSSLLNIGAIELSSAAQELEKASAKNDAAFCDANLPFFSEQLRILGEKLKAAFLELNQNSGPVIIPPELQPIFKRLEDAFAKMDFASIDINMKNLDALSLRGTLKEEIGYIKDAVLVMDYDGATELMRRLLRETKGRPGA